MKDDQRSGRPSTSRTTDSTEQVKQLARADRRLTVRMIASELSISKETAWRIIIEDLGMCKICAKMVPKLLSDNQKERRVLVCKDILECLETEPNLLDKVITGDESWIFEYDPETKRQSLQWKSAGSSRPKKAKMSKSKMELLFIAFFDISGIVHTEFLPQGTTINQHVYKEILRRLIVSVRTKRRDRYESNDWLLHHENASSHNALSIRQFLTERNVTTLDQPHQT